MAQTDESSIRPAPVEESAPGPAEPQPAPPPDRQGTPSALVARPGRRLLLPLIARPWRLLALPAVGLAAYAERLIADARNLGVETPPALSWWLFGLAAVLFM